MFEEVFEGPLRLYRGRLRIVDFLAEEAERGAVVAGYDLRHLLALPCLAVLFSPAHEESIFPTPRNVAVFHAFVSSSLWFHGLPFFFDLDSQRALAAFRAISLRCTAVRDFARALEPLRPRADILIDSSRSLSLSMRRTVLREHISRQA